MSEAMHPMAPHYLPPFIVAPGETDVLFTGSVIFLVPPGSSCIANAYTSNHDRLAEEDLGTAHWLFLHVIGAVGLVHAIILRFQALLLPVQTLIFSGGH